MSPIRRIATPWLWPHLVQVDAPWNLRLGRVIHWGTVIAAAAALLGGVYLSAVTYSNQWEARVEIARWDKRKKSDPYAGIGVPVEHGPWEEYGNSRTWENDPIVDDPDPRPSQVSAEPGLAFMGLLIAAVSLLIGRAARYVLGGE